MCVEIEYGQVTEDADTGLNCTQGQSVLSTYKYRRLAALQNIRYYFPHLLYYLGRP